ncbi:MAG: hypothetical protein RW306_06530 [Geobacteraceae bacterium]|nr:hypothetical protein [Geobacteraceae bacterium]
MCRVIRSNLQLNLIILLILLPMPALAIPAITCHCFSERSYQPSRPAAADPYFLATAQNSFFAVVFNVEKKNIVIKKQQGTSSDDLWIAYWVASGSGKSPEVLLGSRQNRENWNEVIAPLHLPAKSLGTRFSKALSMKSTSGRLAEAVVDELFIRYRLLREAELAAIRQAGASSQELIIAWLIASKTGQSANQVYLEVKNGSETWGSLLQKAKIDPKDMQREISVMLR